MNNLEHLHGNDLVASIFRGVCEVKNNHYHPVFLTVFISPQSNDCWLAIEILNMDNHIHGCQLKEEDVKTFLTEGFLSILTNDKEGHQHKICFDKSYIQKSNFNLF